MPLSTKEITLFWKKTNKNGPVKSLELGPCWIWTGMTRNGYGRFWAKNRLQTAHRISWEIENGRPLESWEELHHKCVNPSCVNPSHLEIHTEMTHPGTMADINRHKTHCPRGHAYNGINTRYYTTATGGIGRACRLCSADKP